MTARSTEVLATIDHEKASYLPFGAIVREEGGHHSAENILAAQKYPV